jgi:N-acetylglucosamine-6-phosphate deacetylase
MRLGVERALVAGRFVPGDVEIDDARVVGVGSRSPGGTGLAVPGLVDLQVNGYAGIDFLHADADGYRRAGRALLEAGVTAYQPTFITSPEEDLVAALRELRAAEGLPRIIGAHLEGPFLSPERLGAHPPHARRDPDAALLERLLAADPVSQVTLAPELPGAESLMAVLRAHGVTISCGHSDATAHEAHDAFAQGATTVTHIFNAMRPFSAREPGLAVAALTSTDVFEQMILDRAHLADETARLVWQLAAGRVALVTDAIAAAGLGDGTYALGGAEVNVQRGIARRPDGVLAGSTVPLLQGVRNLVELGAPLEAAFVAATEIPARIVRRPDLGRLEPGSPADVVVLDDSLEIVRVLPDGRDRAG